MITQERLKGLLHYNPETGVFTWKAQGPGRFKRNGDCARWNTRYAGKRAGSVHKGHSGYLCRAISLLGVYTLEHRLAYFYMTGEWPEEIIDHENRDATDNRWVNIKASTYAMNQKNRSRSRTNTSGVTGVCWCKRTEKWVARVQGRGNTLFLGYHEDLDVAARLVERARAEQGYHPDHGNEIAHYHAAGGASS